MGGRVSKLPQARRRSQSIRPRRSSSRASFPDRLQPHQLAPAALLVARAIEKATAIGKQTVRVLVWPCGCDAVSAAHAINTALHDVDDGRLSLLLVPVSLCFTERSPCGVPDAMLDTVVRTVDSADLVLLVVAADAAASADPAAFERACYARAQSPHSSDADALWFAAEVLQAASDAPPAVSLSALVAKRTLHNATPLLSVALAPQNPEGPSSSSSTAPQQSNEADNLCVESRSVASLPHHHNTTDPLRAWLAHTPTSDECAQVALSSPNDCADAVRRLISAVRAPPTHADDLDAALFNSEALFASLCLDDIANGQEEPFFHTRFIQISNEIKAHFAATTSGSTSSSRKNQNNCGGVVLLLGPDGVGKATLLARFICQLELPVHDQSQQVDQWEDCDTAASETPPGMATPHCPAPLVLSFFGRTPDRFTLVSSLVNQLTRWLGLAVAPVSPTVSEARHLLVQLMHTAVASARWSAVYIVVSDIHLCAPDWPDWLPRMAALCAVHILLSGNNIDAPQSVAHTAHVRTIRVPLVNRLGRRHLVRVALDSLGVQRDSPTRRLDEDSLPQRSEDKDCTHWLDGATSLPLCHRLALTAARSCLTCEAAHNCYTAVVSMPTCEEVALAALDQCMRQAAAGECAAAIADVLAALVCTHSGLIERHLVEWCTHCGYTTGTVHFVLATLHPLLVANGRHIRIAHPVVCTAVLRIVFDSDDDGSRVMRHRRRLCDFFAARLEQAAGRRSMLRQILPELGWLLMTVDDGREQLCALLADLSVFETLYASHLRELFMQLWLHCLESNSGGATLVRGYMAQLHAKVHNVEQSVRLKEEADHSATRSTDVIGDQEGMGREKCGVGVGSLSAARRTVASELKEKRRRSSQMLEEEVSRHRRHSRRLASEEEGAVVPGEASLPAMAGQYYRVACFLLGMGDAFGALEPLGRAVELYERVFGGGHLDVATALNNLAMVHMRVGQLSSALELYERARRVYEQYAVVRKEATTTTSAEQVLVTGERTGFDRRRLSWRLSQRRRKKQEKKKKSISCDTSQQDEDAVAVVSQLHIATTEHNMGLVCEKMMRLREAERYYASALAMRERLLGVMHVDTLASQWSLAGLLVSQLRWDDAVVVLEDLVGLRTTAQGAWHPGTVDALEALGRVYAALEGRSDDALRVFRDVYRVRRASGDPAALARTAHNLGSVLVRVGQPNEARGLLEEAMRTQESTLGEVHCDTAATWLTLARLSRSVGDTSGAMALYLRVIEARERCAGVTNSDLELMTARSGLATLYCAGAQGEQERALELYALVLDGMGSVAARAGERGHLAVQWARLNRAVVLGSAAEAHVALGHSQQGLQMYAEAMAAAEVEEGETRGRQCVVVAELCSQYATHLVSSGCVEEAEEHLYATVRQLDASIASLSLTTAENARVNALLPSLLTKLARLLRMRGDHVAADLLDERNKLDDNKVSSRDSPATHEAYLRELSLLNLQIALSRSVRVTLV